jgi:hypothetical protein
MNRTLFGFGIQMVWFQMVCFTAIKWSKLDKMAQFLNIHSKTGLFCLDFIWLKQDGGQKWSGIRMALLDG